MGVCDPATYLRMGRVHTMKDQEISHEEARKVAEKVMAHTAQLLKCFNLGVKRAHEPRFRESLLGRGHPAEMTLLIKDHKPRDIDGLPKTRSVVAGNSSNNVGFSEIISEVVESITKARKGKNLSVISSDDILARMVKIDKRIQEAEFKEEHSESSFVR